MQVSGGGLPCFFRFHLTMVPLIPATMVIPIPDNNEQVVIIRVPTSECLSILFAFLIKRQGIYITIGNQCQVMQNPLIQRGLGKCNVMKFVDKTFCVHFLERSYRDCSIVY